MQNRYVADIGDYVKLAILRALSPDRNLGVAVGLHVAVSRKVFAAVLHAGLQQALHHALREHGGDPRIAVERTVAEHSRSYYWDRLLKKYFERRLVRY